MVPLGAFSSIDMQWGFALSWVSAQTLVIGLSIPVTSRVVYYIDKHHLIRFLSNSVLINLHTFPN